MSQAEKSQLYKTLQAAGATFQKHYREYTTEELAAAVAKLPHHIVPTEQAPTEPTPDFDGMSVGERMQAQMAAFLAEEKAAEPEPTPKPAMQAPAEQAGLRAYHADEGEQPIRTDERGLVWYRDEVLKPALPRPRARRKLTYVDSGTTTRTVANGQFMESFEIAGTEHRQAEVRITLPSYQVGVYKDPRMPFKIHIYNGNRGFDYFEVVKFYGGSDLVPPEVKKLYVGNDLCFDIRTTIRAIETEYRQHLLQAQKGM